MNEGSSQPEFAASGGVEDEDDDEDENDQGEGPGKARGGLAIWCVLPSRKSTNQQTYRVYKETKLRSSRVEYLIDWVACVGLIRRRCRIETAGLASVTLGV